MTSNNKGNAIAADIGLIVLLFGCFVALKLSHVMDLSWWVVSAPLWVPIPILLWVLVYDKRKRGKVNDING